MRPDSMIRRAMADEPGGGMAMLRGGLRAASWVYGAAVRLRNRRYGDGGERSIKLPVPVISVGNITTGGTGKTPLVIDLCCRLERAGHRVGVLSRGYGGRPGRLNDENQLITRRLPNVVCVTDADRVAAGRRAIDEHGVTCLVADDAFQHRRLARDLDIVVIDATDPFGNGHLLPRGLLREPLEGLKRADLIVLSRCDQVDIWRIQAISAKLDGVSPHVDRLKSSHEVMGFAQLDGQPADFGATPSKPVIAAAAIGNPEAFAQTLLGLFFRIVKRSWFPDHHHFTHDDVKRLAQDCRDSGAEALIVTEKDAVKLESLVGPEFPCPVYALVIEIAFLDDGGNILDDELDKLFRGSVGK